METILMPYSEIKMKKKHYEKKNYETKWPWKFGDFIIPKIRIGFLELYLIWSVVFLGF